MKLGTTVTDGIMSLKKSRLDFINFEEKKLKLYMHGDFFFDW